jgi:hypothetical protein
VQSRSVVEPRSFYASLNCEGSSVSENSAELGQLIVGPDDNVYALARSSRLVQNFLNCADFSSEMSASLQLLKLSPDGAITLTPIDQASDSIPVWPNNLAPDGQGGFLAWGSWNVFGTEARPAMYITSDGGHTNLDAPILNPPAIGNDGTAYITTDNGTKAFLPSTQETRWTSPILGTVVAVDANDGAVVQNDQTLYRIDGNGVADAGTTVALRNPQYWSMGVWHGQSTDTFGPAAQQGPMVNDDAFLLRTTDPLNDSASSITAGGNLAGQGQTVKPEVVSYVTENVLRGGPLPWFATDFWNRFKDQVPALKVKRTSLLVENARLFRFFQDIQDETFSLQMASPVQAVGFIGHAVYIPSDDPDGGPRYSVGLEFFDRDLIKLKDPLPLPYGHQWVNKKEGRGEATAWWVEQVRTQIKVVFISSCYVGPQFKSLWNIDDDTQGRALVVPDTQDEVNFDVGGEAWTMISKDLAAGKSIGAAVDHYNLGPGQHWMVIGDRGVKLTPTPR